MTRKEAIEHGKKQLEIFGEECKHYEFIKMAIKALEQEPILDEIRAEIDEQYNWLINTRHTIYDIDIAFDAIKSVLVESEDNK